MDYHIVLFLFIYCTKTRYISAYNTRPVLTKLLKLKELIEKRSYIHTASDNIVKCIPLNFDSLLHQYKTQSGYNNIYVASTPKEAILFPNLLWDVKKRNIYVKLVSQLSGLFDHMKNHTDPNIILKFKNTIAEKINASLSETTGLASTSSDMGKRQQNGERVSVATTRCSKVGDTDPITRNVNLCEQCSMTTTLNANRFPRYVNEVTCGTTTKCFKGEGKCKQNKRLMNFLRKTDRCKKAMQNNHEVWIEEWVLTRDPISVSCECQIRKSSILLSFI